MKILLLAAGRRYSLVQRLQRAGFEVFAIEKDTQCPISQLCRVIWSGDDQETEKEIIQTTIDEKHIDCILPLNDFWGAYAHSYFDRLHNSSGTIVIGCDTGGVYCRDKLLLQKLLSEHRDPLIRRLYPKITLFKDYIYKPRIGNLSRGVKVYKWYNPTGYLYAISTDEGICQRYIKGPEYTVDAYFDKEGRFINSIARHRLRVEGGEVVDATAMPTGSYVDYEIKCHTEAIGIAIGSNWINRFRGPMCFQYMWDNENHAFYLTEINARFGGGCILSLECGFDMIQMIIDEYILGKSIKHWKEKRFPSKTMKRVSYETFYNNV